MRIISHTLALGTVLTIGSMIAFNTVAGAADEAVFVDTKAVHACYARASHRLVADGADVIASEREFSTFRGADGWQVLGKLRTSGDQGERIYAVDCQVNADGVSVELTRAPIDA